MSWLDTLQNASIKFSVTDYTADSELTYEEMLVLFQNVSVDGVTSEEFSDLQSIYTNGYSLFENNYVRTISYNVINGHPSNATFTGGVKSSSGIVSLGNMKAGMSADKATLLVGDGLGIDLPIPKAGGDAANPTSTGGSFSYALSTGSLEARKPRMSINNVGTCYFVGGSGSIAHTAPQYITNANVDNGNGTYGVRFFGSKSSG